MNKKTPPICIGGVPYKIVFNMISYPFPTRQRFMNIHMSIEQQHIIMDEVCLPVISCEKAFKIILFLKQISFSFEKQR